MARAAPVLAHDHVPLPVPADLDRPLRARLRSRDRALAHGARRLPPRVGLLDPGLRDQLFRRRRDRRRHGVPVRHELGRLLALRRRHLRRAARRRGHLRVLPRVGVFGAPRLRAAAHLLLRPVARLGARGARNRALGLLDPRRELLDADARRLSDRGRARRPHGRPRRVPERLDAAALRAHDLGGALHGRLRDGGRRGLVGAAGHPPRRRPRVPAPRRRRRLRRRPARLLHGRPARAAGRAHPAREVRGDGGDLLDRAGRAAHPLLPAADPARPQAGRPRSRSRS